MANCKHCTRRIPLDRNTNAIYCSRHCASKHYELMRLPKRGKAVNLCTGTIGAMGELRVCVDLLERGYYVFRAVSPACACDLIASNAAGKCVRIEVRAATEHPNTGRIFVPKTDMSRYDVLAKVLPSRIEYEPDIRLAFED